MACSAFTVRLFHSLHLAGLYDAVFHAVIMACFAFFALLLDTLCLAPTMDILNIASPVLQYLAAAGIAALCTAYFEITGLLYIGARNSWLKRLVAIAAGIVGVFSLIAWGILRGYTLSSTSRRMRLNRRERLSKKSTP